MRKGGEADDDARSGCRGICQDSSSWYDDEHGVPGHELMNKKGGETMEKNQVFENGNINPDHTLKTTALLYLQEALAQEKFETCAALVRTAKRFGAADYEVAAVIAGYVHKVQGGKTKEVIRKKGKGRPRF